MLGGGEKGQVELSKRAMDLAFGMRIGTYYHVIVAGI